MFSYDMFNQEERGGQLHLAGSWYNRIAIVRHQVSNMTKKSPVKDNEVEQKKQC